MIIMKKIDYKKRTIERNAKTKMLKEMYGICTRVGCSNPRGRDLKFLCEQCFRTYSDDDGDDSRFVIRYK